MATKIYLRSSGTYPITPPPSADAGWTNTSMAVHYPAGTTKASTTMSTLRVFDGLNTQQDLLVGQWMTIPLTVGQTITGGQTVQIVIRGSEYDPRSNLYLSWVVKIVNETTTKKVIVAKRNDLTELAVATLTTRTDSMTSAAGNYTTVSGDRLVIEIGVEGDPTSSFIHDGSLRVGDAAASDLAYSDGVTTDNNPSVQLSDTLTFEDYLSVSKSEAVGVQEITTVSLSTALAPNVSSSINVSETVALLQNRLISAHEDISAADMPSGKPLISESISQTVTVTDVIRYYPDSILVDERVTVSIGGITGFGASATENITVSESVAGNIPVSINTSQSITVGENVAASMPDALAINKSETIVLVDDPNVVTVTAGELYVTVNDGIIVTGATGREVSTSTVNVHEDIGAAESTGMAISAIQVNISQAIGVGESASTNITRLISVSSNITVSESKNIVTACRVNVSDSVAVNSFNTTTSISPVTAWIINVSDAVHVSESNSVGYPYTALINLNMAGRLKTLEHEDRNTLNRFGVLTVERKK